MLTFACCAVAGLAFAQPSQADHGFTPVGASPTRVSLVPYFEQCMPAAVNSEHGGPLMFPSCNPPDRTAGPAPVTAAVMGPSSLGFVRYVVCPVGAVGAFCTPAGGVMPLPDDRITGSIIDVQCGLAPTPGCPAPGMDYNPDPSPPPYGAPGTGSTAPTPPCFPTATSASDCVASADLEVAPDIPGSVAGPPPGTSSYRVTDHENCDPPPANPAPGPACPALDGGPDYGATMVDISGYPGIPSPDPPGIPMACIPTAAPGVGSSCGVNTTLNALSPGLVIPGKEATVQIGQVRIRDSGPNGTLLDPFDPRDNMVFAVQGIFNP